MNVSRAQVIPQKTRESPRLVNWWPRLELLLLFLFMLFFVVKGLLPAWNRSDSDFPNYYLVARLYRAGYPVERVYDPVWLQRQKDHAGINKALVGFTSPPASSLVALPLSSLSLTQARHCWLLISLALLLITVALLKRLTQLGWVRIELLTLLAVSPLQKTFQLGQIDLAVLLLLTISAWLYLRKSQFWSGILISLAATISIYPSAFFIFFLLKKQWRAVCGLLLGCAGTAALSVYLFGLNACGFYWRIVLPHALRGELIDPYDLGWDSLHSLLRRLFIWEPELNPGPIAHLPTLFAVLYTSICSLVIVIFLWAICFGSQGAKRQGFEWASYLFLVLLITPTQLPSQLVGLILFAVLTIDYLLAHVQSGGAILVAGLYAISSLPFDRFHTSDPHGWSNLVHSPRLFFLFALAGLALWCLIREPGADMQKPLRQRRFTVCAVAFVTLSVLGSILTLRHLERQFDNYSSRITTVVGSAMAFDPAVASGDLLFSRLVPRFSGHDTDAYAIYRIHGDKKSVYRGGGDWFHPAVPENGHTAVAEIANDRGSQVVRIDLLSGSIHLVSGNAEQPAVSRDGILLAFIREVKGRGSLWVRQAGNTGNTADSTGDPTAERLLADSGYDVRDASFNPDNRIVFSGRRRERFALYLADPESGNITTISAITCSARYPAASPDGRQLAFSCDVGGNWQLFTLEVATGRQNQLTRSDCNSITPAWTGDSKNLIYATDCARGLGVTALSEIRVAQDDH